MTASEWTGSSWKLFCAWAGMTMCQSLDSLAFGMYGSPEMVVMCDEMVHMIKRIRDGFTVHDDTLALDVIRSVGFGGIS
jgi:trimethylamine--corrinoid protein Co-methyltransferase